MDKSPTVQFPVSTSKWWSCHVWSSWTYEQLSYCYNWNTFLHFGDFSAHLSLLLLSNCTRPKTLSDCISVAHHHWYPDVWTTHYCSPVQILEWCNSFCETSTVASIVQLQLHMQLNVHAPKLNVDHDDWAGKDTLHKLQLQLENIMHIIFGFITKAWHIMWQKPPSAAVDTCLKII